jgi:hypothetical protein
VEDHPTSTATVVDWAVENHPTSTTVVDEVREDRPTITATVVNGMVDGCSPSSAAAVSYRGKNKTKKKAQQGATSISISS